MGWMFYENEENTEDEKITEDLEISEENFDFIGTIFTPMGCLCRGSLIAENYVLTARNCFNADMIDPKMLKQGNVYVEFHPTELPDFSLKHSVSEIFLHHGKSNQSKLYHQVISYAKKGGGALSRDKRLKRREIQISSVKKP